MYKNIHQYFANNGITVMGMMPLMIIFAILAAGLPLVRSLNDGMDFDTWLHLFVAAMFLIWTYGGVGNCLKVKDAQPLRYPHGLMKPSKVNTVFTAIFAGLALFTLGQMIVTPNMDILVNCVSAFGWVGYNLVHRLTWEYHLANSAAEV